jgi:hypothetical protein
MKFRFTVEVDINFDLECDGDVSTEAESLDSDIVGQTIKAHLCDGEFLDTMVDRIAEAAGWCINSLSLTVPDAECIDYLNQD